MIDTALYLFDLKSKFLKINPSEYYLAYSGGKDSHLIYWFLRIYLKEHDHAMYERYKEIPIIAVNTYMEFPEISRRMIDNADEVLTPSMKPHEVIAKVGTPCFGKIKDEFIRRYQNGNRSPHLIKMIDGQKHREVDGKAYKSRFALTDISSAMLLSGVLPKISSQCCDYLKKQPSLNYEEKTGRHAILGITHGESMTRDAKYKSCFTKDLKFIPLWDADDELINALNNEYQIEVPKIYDYITQTGCAGCPYGIRQGHTQIELQLMTPQKRAYVERLFGDAYRVRGLNHLQMDISQYENEKENV